MESNKAFQEERKKHLRNWKDFTSELTQLLTHSKEEIQDDFEQCRKSLKSKMEEYLADLRYSQNISQGTMQSVVKSLEDLKIKADQAKCDSEKELLQQQENLSSGIDELRTNLSTALDSAEKETAHFLDKIDDRLEFFNAQFGLLRTQIQLGEAKSKAEWEEAKSEIQEKIEAFKEMLEDSEENIHKKWKEYSAEMKGIWKEFKTAFRK